MRNPYKDFSKIDPGEGGYRQINSALFQALIRAGFSAPEYKVILFVFDKTNGWGKTQDSIALSQFAEGTGLDRSYCHHVIKDLEERHIIVTQRSGKGRGQRNAYMVNPHWDTWNIPNLPELGSTAQQIDMISEQHSTKPDEIVSPTQQTNVNVEQIPGNAESHSAEMLSPTPPQYKDLEKKIINTTTSKGEGAEELLDILGRLPGWRIEEEDDARWLAEISGDYVEFSALKIKECRDYFSGKPVPKHKGIWKNRLRQWMQHDEKYGKERAGLVSAKKEVAVGKPREHQFATPITYLEV